MSLDIFIKLSCSLVVKLVLLKSLLNESISQLLLELGIGSNIWTSRSILQMSKLSSFSSELSIRLLEEINTQMTHSYNFKWLTIGQFFKKKFPLFIGFGALGPLWNLLWISRCDVMADFIWYECIFTCYMAAFVLFSLAYNN